MYREFAGTAWIILCSLLLTGCGVKLDDRTATEKAIDELQKKYDELVADKLENPVDWAADDLENIGDWEYKVVDMNMDDATAAEEALNTLGDDRWEVFWLERNGGEFRLMLKRPSRSYLSRIPLSQIGRFVIGGPAGEE